MSNPLIFGDVLRDRGTGGGIIGFPQVFSLDQGGADKGTLTSGPNV